MSGRFTRHDLVVSVLLQMFLDAGFVARKEVMVIPGRQKRMDIVVYLPNGAQWWIDVSITSPYGRSAINKNHVAGRETHKRSKWETFAETAGAVFIPAVFSTTGCVGGGAASILGKVTAKALENFPYYLSGQEEKEWMSKYHRELVERLAIVIAISNANIVEEASIKARTYHVRYRPERGSFRYLRRSRRLL